MWLFLIGTFLLPSAYALRYKHLTASAADVDWLDFLNMVAYLTACYPCCRCLRSTELLSLTGWKEVITGKRIVNPEYDNGATYIHKLYYKEC